MVCKGCGLVLQNNYIFCPHCGENAHPHKLNIKHIFHEFVHAFTHADKGIFLLVKSLAVKPGKAALDYVEGDRKKYFNPVNFLLITGGLAFFLRNKLGFTGNISSKKMALYVSQFLHQFTTPVVILSIPLLALYSWLFFRSTGKNYAENAVMNMYMIGEYHLFSIIVVVIPSYFFPQAAVLFTVMGFFAMCFYNYFTALHFFNQSKGTTLFKVVCIELLFVLSFGLIMGISFVFYLIQTGHHIKELR